MKVNPANQPKDKRRNSILALTISAALLTSIATHEGYSSKAYRPLPPDVPTIGFGTTVYPDGTPVKMQDVITREDANRFLKHDTEKFIKEMNRCIKVPISQGEFEAYTSLTYNIGSGAFCRSTLVKKLNTWDYKGACDEILRWSFFKGKQLPGLVKRRNQEYQLCLS